MSSLSGNVGDINHIVELLREVLSESFPLVREGVHIFKTVAGAEQGRDSVTPHASLRPYLALHHRFADFEEV
jgi:hypothetical protein